MTVITNVTKQQQQHKYKNDINKITQKTCMLKQNML